MYGEDTWMMMTDKSGTHHNSLQHDKRGAPCGPFGIVDPGLWLNYAAAMSW